jgi:hypothetical protein
MNYHLFDLESINFHDNKIKQLPDGIFFGLAHLKKIDFSENNLKSLQFNIFNGLFNLESLNFNYFYFNPIIIDGLQNLNLYECLMTRQLELFVME